MPRLDLHHTVVLDDEDLSQLRSADQILHEVADTVAAFGLVDYPRPPNLPRQLGEFTEDQLQALQNEELGILYLQYTSYAQHINTNLAKVTAAYKTAESNLKHIEAKLLVKMYAKGVSKKEAQSLVREHPLYMEYDLEKLKLYTSKIVLDAYYSAYDKQAGALSRIVAIRELEFDKATRGASIEHIKKANKPLPRRGWKNG